MCISIYYNIYIYIHMIVCRDASLYKRPRHPLKWVQGPGPLGSQVLFPDGMLLECIINVNVLGNTYPLVNVNQKRTGKIHHAIFAMSGHNQRLQKVSQVRLVNIKWWPSLDWGICHVETNPWCYFPFLGKPRPNFLLHPENLKKL